MRPLPRRSLAAACTLAVAFVVIAAVSGPPARAQTKLSGVLTANGYRWVPLKRPTRNTLAVAVEVNGRRALLVVDSGAPASGLRRAWLRRLGGTSTAVEGSVQGFAGSEEKGLRRVEVDDLRVGDVQVGRTGLVISDFLGIQNIQGSNYTPTGSFIPVRAEPGEPMNVDGFFGADLLTACHAIVDLKNFRLYLQAPGARPRAVLGPGLQNAGLVEVPIERTGQRFLVRGEINGQAGTLLLDTGANLTSINAAQAGRLGLSGQSSRVRSRDVGGRERDARYARLDRLRLGAWEKRAFGVSLETFPAGASGLLGLLGVDVLSPHGAIIDCGQGRLYLERPR